jgi:hypothetical protein
MDEFNLDDWLMVYWLDKFMNIKMDDNYNIFVFIICIIR